MKATLFNNGTIKLTLEAKTHFDELVQSKLLAGLNRDQAESKAEQQILRDAGIVPDAGPELTHEEKVATAGANAFAKSPTDKAEVTPVEIHFSKGKISKRDVVVSKPAKA